MLGWWLISGLALAEPAEDAAEPDASAPATAAAAPADRSPDRAPEGPGVRILGSTVLLPTLPGMDPPGERPAPPPGPGTPDGLPPPAPRASAGVVPHGPVGAAPEGAPTTSASSGPSGVATPEGAAETSASSGAPVNTPPNGSPANQTPSGLPGGDAPEGLVETSAPGEASASAAPTDSPSPPNPPNPAPEAPPHGTVRDPAVIASFPEPPAPEPPNNGPLVGALLGAAAGAYAAGVPVGIAVGLRRDRPANWEDVGAPRDAWQDGSVAGAGFLGAVAGAVVGGAYGNAGEDAAIAAASGMSLGAFYGLQAGRLGVPRGSDRFWEGTRAVGYAGAGVGLVLGVRARDLPASDALRRDLAVASGAMFAAGGIRLFDGDPTTRGGALATTASSLAFWWGSERLHAAGLRPDRGHATLFSLHASWLTLWLAAADGDGPEGKLGPALWTSWGIAYLGSWATSPLASPDEEAVLLSMFGTLAGEAVGVGLPLAGGAGRGEPRGTVLAGLGAGLAGHALGTVVADRVDLSERDVGLLTTTTAAGIAQGAGWAAYADDGYDTPYESQGWFFLWSGGGALTGMALAPALEVPGRTQVAALSGGVGLGGIAAGTACFVGASPRAQLGAALAASEVGLVGVLLTEDRLSRPLAGALVASGLGALSGRVTTEAMGLQGRAACAAPLAGAVAAGALGGLAGLGAETDLAQTWELPRFGRPLAGSVRPGPFTWRPRLEVLPRFAPEGGAGGQVTVSFVETRRPTH